MNDPMDMTEEEFRLYQAQQRAAGVYRSEGFHGFASRVEAGREDTCSQMRIARFFIDPSPPPPQKYIDAWEQLGSEDGAGPHAACGDKMLPRAGVATE